MAKHRLIFGRNSVCNRARDPVFAIEIDVFDRLAEPGCDAGDVLPVEPSTSVIGVILFIATMGYRCEANNERTKSDTAHCFPLGLSMLRDARDSRLIGINLGKDYPQNEMLPSVSRMPK
ncbi:hypothetical protein AQ611_08855 [Burkholderia singularis]|nr:hypothetical protein AQ611_08855 [Burkholderia sp. Bp7605]